MFKVMGSPFSLWSSFSDVLRISSLFDKYGTIDDGDVDEDVFDDDDVDDGEKWDDAFNDLRRRSFMARWKPSKCSVLLAL